MGDLARFLRFFVPGAIFFLELIVLLLIGGTVDWAETKGLATDFSAAFTLVVSSGAVGALLSIIHHTKYWSGWGSKWTAMNHRRFLEHMVASGKLAIVVSGESGGEDTVTPDRLSPAGGWRVVTTVWCQLLSSPTGELRDGNTRVDSLTSLLHGNGSALAGSVCAVVAWAAIHLHRAAYAPDTTACESYAAPTIAALAGVGFIVLHFVSFRQIREHAQGVVETLLAGELARVPHPPRRVLVSKRDLEG